MFKLSIILSLVFLASCSKTPTSRAPHLEVIHNLTTSNGSLVGTLYGVEIADSLYSEFFVVNNGDTLYRIDSTGFHNPKGLQAGASTEGYDGWRINLTGPASFETWLSKKDGTSSDPADLQWVDSLKAFSLELAGEPVE